MPVLDDADATGTETGAMQLELSDISVQEGDSTPGRSEASSENSEVSAGQPLIGRYRLGRLIGRGGMGSVYVARDTLLGRDVAAKVVGEFEHLSSENRRRFEREGLALAALSSPHLPTVHDMGVEGGVGYLIMQYIEAPTLSRMLAREGKLALPRAGALLCQLLDALDHVHESGFIHRDVKPSNILIDENDHLTLVDLGVALQVAAPPLTGRGYAVGTPRFMSPEQRLGRKVDRRCDIYAVGLLAGLMVFGAVPYNAWRFTPETIDFTASGLPAPWVEIIEGCVAERPDDRFADCAIVKARVEGAMASIGAAL